MMGWAGRQTRRANIRSGGPLVPLQVRDFSRIRALESESPVSPHGGWNARGSGWPAGETVQDAGSRSLAEARSAVAARVRWNLSA